jgi:hypothetical protein
MADPISLTVMGLSAAGGIIGGLGAKEAADATSNMYQYKAGVAQANARIAAANAQYEREVGDVRVQRAGLEGGQVLGTMKVGQAASGLQVGTGSAALTRTSQIAGIQSNEAAIQSDAARKAYGYEVQGMDYTAEAGLDVLSAQNAQTAGQWQEASSFLSGATSVADKWSKFSQAGVGGGSSGGFSWGSLFSGGGTPVVG